MIDGSQASRILDRELEEYSDPSLVSDYLKIWSLDPGNDSVRFQLAVLLSKSSDPTHRQQSLGHFEYLSQRPPFVNDALFHFALVQYHNEDYDNARTVCEQLYRLEPDNSKQQEKAEREQAAVGITVGLGVAAAVGLGLALMLGGRKK